MVLDSNAYFAFHFVVILSGLLVLFAMANAQEPPMESAQESPEIIELQKQVKRKQLEVDLAKMEKESLQAERDVLKESAPTSPESDELEKQIKRKQLEAEIAQKEQARMQAERDALKARREQFAGPNITPVDGKISYGADSIVLIETRVLAQRAVCKCVEACVGELAKKFTTVQNPVTLIIYNPADISAIPTYVSLLAQTDLFQQSFSRLNNEADNNLSLQPGVLTLAVDPLLVPIAVSGILKSVAEVTQLFQNSTDIKAMDLQMDEALLVSMLVHAVQEKKPSWKVFYPAVYPVDMIPASARTSQFLETINETTALQEKAKSNIANLNARIEEWKQKRAQDKNKTKEFDEIIAKLEKTKGHLQALNNSHDQLLSLLHAVDPQTKLAGQASLLRMERLYEKLRQEHAYVLKLAVIAKGTNRITKNLWGNARIAHSAGAELNYQLYAPDGSLILADSIYEYTPYTKPDAIGKTSKTPNATAQNTKPDAIGKASKAPNATAQNATAPNNPTEKNHGK